MASRSERATTWPPYKSRWLWSRASIRFTARAQSSTPTNPLNAIIARILTPIGRSANQPPRRRPGRVAVAFIGEDLLNWRAAGRSTSRPFRRTFRHIRHERRRRNYAHAGGGREWLARRV